MESIVQAETPNRLHILKGQRSEEVPDLGHLVSHVILAKDVALDDTGLLCLDDIADTLWEYSIAVIGTAVSGEEADEALSLRVSQEGNPSDEPQGRSAKMNSLRTQAL